MIADLFEPPGASGTTGGAKNHSQMPAMPPTIDLAKLVQAIDTAPVYDVATVSPLEQAPALSEALGNTVLIKREDLQVVHSFKLRGAYNKLMRLPQELRAKGLVAASAGNHAQGVALAGQALGVATTIVMPTTTPPIKINAVRSRGAAVELTGDSYDDAAQAGMALAAERGQTFVPPYDDLDVIAGQGTVGKEILEQADGHIDAIYVPVGGGGLMAGVAAWVQAHSPETEIVAVEPNDAACLTRALEVGEPVRLEQVGIFADGVAVRQVGALPFEIARNHVARCVNVGSDAICAAIRDIYEANRSVAEPAGALALAGLRADVEARGLRGKTLVAIESGSNINFDRLRFVAERTALGAHQEALLAVTMPEVAGSFPQFCRLVGKRNVTEFNYRYADADEAHVFVGIALQGGAQEKAEVLAALEQGGYGVIDLSDNEMAKVHLRHLVGGRVPGLEDELLLRFEFPERPGALMQFLDRVGGRWNISLFHYRNHGAASGRVLAGIQVPPAERAEFHDSLAQIGYPMWDETDNPAFRLFL